MNAINKISVWIGHRYSATLMLILFLIVFGFFWLFNFSPFPVSNAEFIRLSGHEGLLDTMFFYTAQEAFMALAHYGEKGRELYQIFIAADFLFIIFYSFAFAFLMTAITRLVYGENSLWSRLNLLPLTIGFWDCIENICIYSMLRVYPSNNAVLGTISGYATLLKWLLTVVLILFLIYGSILLLLHYLGFEQFTIRR